MGYTTQSFGAHNLRPGAQYWFRVTAGNDFSYNRALGAVISVTTYITRARLSLSFLLMRNLLTPPITRSAPSNLRLVHASETAMTLAWTISPMAILYAIYYREVSSDVAQEFVFQSSVNASQVSLVALKQGRKYEVKVLGIDAKGNEEQVGALLVASTLTNEEDAKSVNVAAASTAAVLGVLVLVLGVGATIFLIRKRRQRKDLMELSDHGNAEVR